MDLDRKQHLKLIFINFPGIFQLNSNLKLIYKMPRINIRHASHLNSLCFYLVHAHGLLTGALHCTLPYSHTTAHTQNKILCGCVLVSSDHHAQSGLRRDWRRRACGFSTIILVNFYAYCSNRKATALLLPIIYYRSKRKLTKEKDYQLKR